MRARASVIALLVLFAAACVDTANESKEPSPSSTPICAQSCQDNVVGYALDETLWLLWNENLAGRPSGTTDTTAVCPLRGSARITGTTGVATNGINTAKLTFELSECSHSNSSYSLSFSGTVTWNGTFSSNNPNALTFQSGALTIAGTVRRNDNPTVSETCALALTDTYDEYSPEQRGWLNGELCGRPVVD